jgi:2-dehydropantoate 2-reductase
MNRIAVVGAGAMGCLFAGRLALAGAQVTVVDVDPKRLELLANEGISLHDDSGASTARVAASTASDLTGPVDLLILFTKAMHSAAAIRSVAHLNDGRCVVLTLQNGLGNVEAISQVFSRDNVLWGVTDIPADLEGPTRVSSHGTGHVWLNGVTKAASRHAQLIVDRLNGAGINALFDPEVDQAVWEKVAFNAALNSLSTITGLPVGGLDCLEGRRIAALVAEETIETAAAHGVTLDRQRLFAKIDFALANHRTHKPSMLQDRLAGRPTEIDSINGAIVAAARTVDISTPATQILADLVRMGDKPRNVQP